MSLRQVMALDVETPLPGAHKTFDSIEAQTMSADPA